MDTLCTITRIQNLGAALVREYLYRKGLQETLNCLDKEFPCTPDSIRSRIALARILSIEKLLNRNREQEYPFKTMIEVIVQYMQEKLVESQNKHALAKKKKKVEACEVQMLEEKQVDGVTPVEFSSTHKTNRLTVSEIYRLKPPNRAQLGDRMCTIVDLKMEELKSLHLRSKTENEHNSNNCDGNSSSENISAKG